MSFLWRQMRDNDDHSCSSDETSKDDDAWNVISETTHPVVPCLEEPPPKVSPMTWEQAHRQACLQNSSLKATISQIESQFAIGQEVPEPDAVLSWETQQQSSSSIVDQLAELLNPNHRVSQPTESAESSLFWRTFQGLWSFARTSNISEESDDDDDNEQEEPKVDLQMTLVHPQLARSVLEYLQSILKSNPHEIIPLSPSSSWKKWVMGQKEATDQIFLSSLPRDELEVLLRVLEHTGVPVSVHTSPSNEIVMVTGTSEDVSVRLVQYDLHQTALRLEQEHLALEEQSKKYQRAALAAKRRKGNPIPSMKLYKLCETQMMHKQNHLLQIETVRMALQQAVNNRSVVQAMGSARTMLQNIHKELDDVHDVMDDLKEVMQDHEEVNAAFQPNISIDIDEDELLQELQSLTLDAGSHDTPNDDKEETDTKDSLTETAKETLPLATEDTGNVDERKTESSPPVPLI